MHPILFDLGPLPIGTYGLILIVGFWAGSLLARHLGVRDGHPPDFISDLTFALLISGVLGAKILLVVVGLLTPLSEAGAITFEEAFSLSTLRAGGVVHGAVIAGVGVFIWKVRTMNFDQVASIGDALVGGLSLGQGIGRWGCLMAGCCFGTPSDSPFAIIFTNPLAALYAGTPLDIALHPTQLYASLSNFLILGILLWAWPRRQFKGQLFAAYFILEGVGRFVIETWRGDLARGTWWNVEGLSTGRLTALLFILFGLSVWLYGRNRLRKNPS